MAPVYDFRHVELDKIGRGKRIVKPPGGECSDIFGSGVSPRSPDQMMTPRKSNNYMQSTIFSPDSPDSPYSSGQHTPTNGQHTPSKLLDTAERLFGSTDDHTPRKIVNRQRSSIFEEEVTPRSAKSAPVRKNQINPITGTPIYENGTSHNGSHNGSLNGSHNGTPNGISNGYSNGTSNGYMNGHSNGMTNGHSSPDSPMNGMPRVRNPPGGKSSGIF